MHRRFVSIILLVLLMCRASPASAQPSPASPRPSPDSCATAVPDLPNDLPTAFAYELDSPAILAFMSTLKAASPRDRTRIFNAAADAAVTPGERHLENVETAMCANLDDIYGTSRALYFIVNQWKLRQFADRKRFEQFSTVVATTIKALSHTDRLAADDRVAGLAWLAPFTESPIAAATPAASGECRRADSNAATIHAVAPDYPALAAVSGTSGQVYVKLSLDSRGEVRSARIFSNTLRRGAGSDDIIRSSILAAAASTYQPAVKMCKPVSSIDLFEISFNRK